MKEIFKILAEDERSRSEEGEQPDRVEPMLATLTREPFSKEGWVFERKLDGERCLAFKNGGSVSLLSRNGKKVNHQYPEVEGAVEKLDGSLIVDGEVVAFDGKATSFAKLQNRMNMRNPDLDITVYYYLFDIIYLDGYDLSALPLRSRK